MDWGAICLLISLIVLYIGITITIIVAIVKSSLGLSAGVIIFIILMSLLISLIVSCAIYYIIRACNAALMNVHPTPLPTHHIPIPLQTKPGTLVQQPDGHLQIAIYEHPTTTN